MTTPTLTESLLLPTDARSFGVYLSVIEQWALNHWHFILFAMFLATSIFALLTILDKLAEKWVATHENDPRYVAIVIRIVARTSSFFRVMAALEIVDGMANTPGRISELIHMVFSIAIVIQLAIWVRELLVSMIERMAHIGKSGSETLETAIVLIRILSSIVIYAVAGIMILDQLGLNVTGLLAGLGIGGIAIGLAAKNVFEELFSALSIIFDEPFKRGDKIRFDTTTARVERVGIKSTRLRSDTGEQLIISNTILLSKEIANLNRPGNRKAEILLNLSKQTSAEKVRAMAEPLEGSLKRMITNLAGRVYRTWVSFRLIISCAMKLASNKPKQILRPSMICIWRYLSILKKLALNWRVRALWRLHKPKEIGHGASLNAWLASCGYYASIKNIEIIKYAVSVTPFCNLHSNRNSLGILTPLRSTKRSSDYAQSSWFRWPVF